MSKRGGSGGATLAVDDLLCFALYSASHAFTQFYKPLLDELGVTYPQYLVLVALWAEDDQTVGGLGEKLFLESNTLTPLLKRLEALGFLGRRRDDADERQVRVRLTPKGNALRGKAREVPRCVLDATGMSLAGVTRLRDEVTAVRDHLRAAKLAM